jgi:hypothetical protein
VIEHARPIYMANDAKRNTKARVKFTDYYARSARVALLLTNQKNIREVIIKNPLAITTFCNLFSSV